MSRWMFDTNQIGAECPEEGAAIGLLALMIGISEECWCAQWMTGLEYSLWACVQGDSNRDYGQGDIDTRDINLLLGLAERCGGWWVFGDKHEHPTFMDLDEWKALYAKVIA